jgi:integrase
MSEDWLKHELMKYETVQRWMNASTQSKAAYRVGCLDALKRYCDFRALNPDQLIDEWIRARREESQTARLKPEDMLKRWGATMTVNGSKNLFWAAVSLKRVRPFFKENGCAVAVKVQMPKTPAHENQMRATPELTRKFVDESRKLEHKWSIICLAQSGMRPGSLCELRYSDLSKSYEKNETPLCIEVPGKITKTGQPYYAFVLDDAKEILHMLLEQKVRRGQTIHPDTKLIDMTSGALLAEISRLTVKLGICSGGGFKPFTSGAWREYVQNKLEAVGIAANRVSLLMGAQPRGRDAHYTNPPPEELAKEYMKAANDLIIYSQFMGKQIVETMTLTPQLLREQFDQFLMKLFTQMKQNGAKDVSLPMLREQFRKAIAESLEE